MRPSCRGLLAVTALALSMIVVAPGTADAKPDKPPINIQILHLSDWHGQVDPTVVGTTQVGGAPALSSYFAEDRADNPLTLTLTGGDAFGATPPISNYFGDAPAVRALNMMGLTADTLGNHNFDGGIAHLQSLIDLADYDIVSANLANVDDNLTGVAPFQIYVIDKVKVAVIGITNEEAPTLVFPGNFGTIVPTDSVAAAMATREAAREQGASVFIVIAHKGVTSISGGGIAQGPLIDFANAVTGFDLILGDHTDVQYSGTHNGALVVEDLSHGEGYSRIQLQVSQTGGRRVVNRSVQFVTPFTASAPGGLDPAIATMLAGYRTQLSGIFSTVVGSSSVVVPRADSCGQSAGRTCESLVGNIVTDAMRTTYGTDFAITNSGGLRANLTCPTVDSATDFCPSFTPPPFAITIGQVNAVLPFGNLTTTVTLDGAEVRSALERGVSAMPGVDGRFAQVSGLCFTYNIEAAAGSRVVSSVRQAGDGTCTGAPVDLTSASTFTVAMNDFMANGGDGYPVVIARSVTRNPLDADVTAYVQSHSPLNPLLQGRVTCFDPNPGSLADCPVGLA